MYELVSIFLFQILLKPEGIDQEAHIGLIIY